MHAIEESIITESRNNVTLLVSIFFFEIYRSADNFIWSVCRSWKKIYFAVIYPISNAPIDLKFGLNMSCGVVHIRKT